MVTYQEIALAFGWGLNDLKDCAIDELFGHWLSADKIIDARAKNGRL